MTEFPAYLESHVTQAIAQFPYEVLRLLEEAGILVSEGSGIYDPAPQIEYDLDVEDCDPISDEELAHYQYLEYLESQRDLEQSMDCPEDFMYWVSGENPDQPSDNG